MPSRSRSEVPRTSLVQQDKAREYSRETLSSADESVAAIDEEAFKTGFVAVGDDEEDDLLSSTKPKKSSGGISGATEAVEGVEFAE